MTFTLIRSRDTGDYALYQDETMVANYFKSDYQWYIDEQISRRMEKSGCDELIEKECDGDFPETLKRGPGRPKKEESNADARDNDS